MSGRLPGGVFGALGGILVALAAKKPSRVHKDAPTSPQGLPKREETGPVHLILMSREVPK